MCERDIKAELYSCGKYIMEYKKWQKIRDSWTSPGAGVITSAEALRNMIKMNADKIFY